MNGFFAILITAAGLNLQNPQDFKQVIAERQTPGFSAITAPPTKKSDDEEPALTLMEKLAREKIMRRWERRADRERRLSALPKRSFTANVSAYTAAYDETGSGDGITASGTGVRAGVTLACPPEYPFGTKVKFEGVGTFVCEDRGGAIKGNRFDIYVKTKKEAFAFGRRHLKAQVIF